MSEIETRLVQKRGCGYPEPGGVYLESIGSPGGTLPIIVVLDPPVPYDHFHRSWVYVDLDAILATREVKYVGSSVASAEEWHLRRIVDPIARDVFGSQARVKDGQVVKFRDKAYRILADAGWQPGGVAHKMQAAQILCGHAQELAPMVEVR